ncbi:GNAT family N-acetyltransferase [Erwinia sp. PK3-005]|uniref:GNAT family N-acetyltransferase n=1 Tax=Mixta hanseatica TaxID=2872648 RepID=A0ABY4R8F6_9GAMM|nr:GNAT family N-acetyltransferase [Mixta hanseatica]UQY43111.1 GNAT family N-acetyltransferase [Mixta hanseatica]
MRLAGTPIVRDFQEGDAESISKLFRIIYGERYVYPEVYLPAMIRHYNQQRRWHTLVATLNGRIVGQASLVWDNAGFDHPELAMMVVHPHYRGAGVATSLGRALCHYAREQGVAALTIKMVSTHTQTQQLACRLGFYTTGLLLDYVDTPFDNQGRESIILGMLPLQPSPLPHGLIDAAAPAWLRQLSRQFGTGPSLPSRERTAPLHIASYGRRVDIRLSSAANQRLIDEVADLPSGCLIHLRIQITPALPSLLTRLHQAGYADMGIAPAADRQWYWLLQRGYTLGERTFRCPVAQALYNSINKSAILPASAADG